MYPEKCKICEYYMKKYAGDKNRTTNGFAQAQEARMIHEVGEALKNGKGYRSVREMIDDILKD